MGAIEDVLEKHAESSELTLANVFRHPDAHPLTLDLVLLKHYGPQVLDWSYETLELIIPRDFKTTVSSVNMQKISACKALHMVDTFWQRWEVFGWVTAGLMGKFPDPDVVQAFTTAECMVAVDIANRIQTDIEFSEEVRLYLAETLRHDGLLVPLPPLDFVHIDTSEYPIDVAEVRDRWLKMPKTSDGPTANTVEDEQLRRMLVADKYLEESRTRRRVQEVKVVAHA